MPHDSGEFGWANLLTVLELLFERKHEMAEPWTQRVGERAMQTRLDRMRETLSERSFPLVEAHWRATSPDLVRRLRADSERGESDQ